MISNRAQIGWSTHGHSAVDVNIYSSGGPGTDAIRGNVENTDIGKFLQSFLGVDTEEVTRILNEKLDTEQQHLFISGQAVTDGTESKEVLGMQAEHWASHEAAAELYLNVD